MYEQPSRLITIANATESGDGSFVATRKKLQTQGESKARLLLNVTALSGNIQGAADFGMGAATRGLKPAAP